MEDDHIVYGGIVCSKGFGNFEEGGVCYGTASVIEASSTMQNAECVSIWDQPDWKEIKEEFDLLQQKPTTWRFNWVDHGGIVQPNIPALS